MNLQAAQFTMLNHCEMGIWDALSLLNELREYEAALYGTSAGLDPDMSLMEHAFQVMGSLVPKGGRAYCLLSSASGAGQC